MKTRTAVVTAGLLVSSLALASCTAAADADETLPVSGVGFYDASVVHSIEVTFDEDDYQAMLDTYAETGDKEWISATVVIDGTTYENVGLKLKGNSSLQGLADAITGETTGDDATDDATDDAATDDAATDDPATDDAATDDTATDEATDDAATGGATDDADGQFPQGGGGGGMSSDLDPDSPEGLPWRIKLDKYVDDQNYEGESDFVVRGSNSETALNEAVTLALLDESGLASQAASATRFSVNGSEQTLRLVIQNPDDQNWYEEEVDDNGVMFKAESGGTYTYQGDNYEDYVDSFDLEANPEDLSDEEAYAPLIEFLDFVNNSDDETFAAELSNYMDVDEFAEYLAFEELVGNTDDIDGPGNNAYLAYDPDTGLFSVIAWDHNLALGSGMGGGGGMGGGQMPDGDQQDGTMPDGATMPTDGATGEPPTEGTMPDGTMPTDGATGEPPTDMEGMEPPTDMEGMEPPTDMEGMEPPTDMEDMQGAGPGGGGQGGGMSGESNPLVTRFTENEDFAALITAASEDLTSTLIDSGFAADVLDQWTSLLEDQASDLVDAETIQSESDAIASVLENTSASE